MLTFFTGEDRICLSSHLLRTICASAAAGVRHQILIVPEQFSHEAERRLCAAGGPEINQSAEVLSMSRLSDRVASVCGGAAKSYLDKGGQLLAMASAAEQIASKIKLYASVLRKPEFLVSIIKMVEEFRSYCLEPQTLLEASQWTEGLFAQKLEELGYLYEAYLSVCANGGADPSDKFIRLVEELQESGWAADRTFYVDGYSDFTGAELQILEALIHQSKNIYVTFTVPNSSVHLDASAEDTMRALKVLASKWSVPVKSVPIPCTSVRTEAIQLLLNTMFSSSDITPQTSKAISLKSFSSIEQECKSLVVTVKQLLSQGVRCREIHVACTDLSLYRSALISSFSAAKIPFYLAGENSVLSSPVIGAVLHALSAAVSPMDYEDIALYLKSGLSCLDREQCDRLDNYAYLWNLRGAQWMHTLEKHPRGFGLSWEDQDHELLRQLDHDREAALQPLLQLRKGLFSAPDTGSMVKSLYAFLETIHLRERLERQANAQLEQGNGQLAQELSQLYELISQSLEQIWLMIGDTVRSPEEFSQLYEMLLSQYDVGTIPVGLDQVQISDIPDLRYRSTPHLFVLGTADGKFPSYKSGEGVLTEEERQQLIHHGIPMAPGNAEQMDRELSWIYAALCAAGETISLSYTGEQPAWLFRRAAALYPKSYATGAGLLFPDIASYASWRVRNGYDVPTGLDTLEKKERQLKELRSYAFTPLTESTVQQLYGRKISLSASKIDKYAACKFAFFLTYGLKAQPLKQAKLDAPAFGTFVHEVLEHTVLRVKDLGGFTEIPEADILTIATEEINRYSKQYFPEQTLRDHYLFHRSEKEIMEIVRDLWEELRHSKFQPAACELSFSDHDGVMPAVEIEGENASCRLTGFVDRVDLYEENGKTYVRVVDYKTGTKNFDYTDILNGAGLQMLIYLFALRQYGSVYLDLGPLEPAGVLYMPAKKQYLLTEAMPEDEEVQKAQQKARKRQGLIREDENLLAAMEDDPEQPVYMPYEVKKSGKQGDLATKRQMVLLERHVLRSVADMADGILSGNVVPDPVVRGQMSSCTYCDYKTVCHRDLGTQQIREYAKTSASLFWDKLEEEEEKHERD